MKELFIAILAIWNVQALPDIALEQSFNPIGFDECVYSQYDNAFAYSRCVSTRNPEKTYHIYETNHRNVLVAPSVCEQGERINLFIKNGEVFEIPMEELFSFYDITL